jgi:hypothetical protein
MVSAALLFLVQPMFAKMVLPMLGGTPAVWNTCMVFYQAMLLAGYLYAHLATRCLGIRRQAGVHLVLMALPWIVLPIAVATAWTPPGGAANPVPWLLMLLLVSVGLPFFIVSASAPMLQAWFADTGHRAGRDPYFLYAASNLGSMLALVGYPLVVERYLKLAEQSRVWAIGYAVLMLLTGGCALLLWSRRGVAQPAGSAHPEVEDRPLSVPTLWLRLRWLALSFVPSSLLLGVTMYISTDIAAVPLLWVMPLALYLLTFVLVFARWPSWLSQEVLRTWPRARWLAGALDPHWICVWLQPFLLVAIAMALFETVTANMGWIILLHLATFFIAAMVCHGELARSRPAARYLTEFYLWMSVGGVLGGAFNAIVAPLAFRSVPLVLEYPLAMVLACMLRPPVLRTRWPNLSRLLDLLLPIGLWCGLYLLKNLSTGWHFRAGLQWLDRDAWNWAGDLNDLVTRWTGKNFHLTEAMLILGLGGLVAFAFQVRPVRFATGIGVVLLAGHLWFSGAATDRVYTDRSFFGIMRVKETTYEPYVEPDLEKALAQDETPPPGTYIKRTLIHGSTNHGEQRFDPVWRTRPVTYYFPTGPIGEVFTKLIDPGVNRQIGIIGLGTGTTAAFGKPGQQFTYFEIDSHVRTIAETSGLFTYLNDTPAEYEIVMGDARLSLEKQPDHKFDLLLVDAFSSDAIPVHLLTREAVDLFFQKLKPNGILLVHISNRHLDLAPVVGNIAEDLRLVARVRNDSELFFSFAESMNGKFASEVVVVVRDAKRLGPLDDDPEWEEIPPDDDVGVWTDDYSNVLAVVHWLKKAKPAPEEPAEPEPEEEQE